MMDGLAPERIVIGATNVPDHLDPALRRRLFMEVTFELPKPDARRQMITRWLARVPISPARVDELVAESEGLAGAAIRARAMAVGRELVMTNG
jgi:AAA+ superfamily predicted ATPase